MEKASFILPKLAVFVLLLSVVVPMFGEGQMVIEEVIMRESKAMNVEEKKSDLGYVCASLHEACGGSAGLFCCPGLHCITSPDSPPETPGVCMMPQCAQFGKECSGSVPIVCCSGLSCFTPPGSGDGAPGTCIVPF